MNFPGNPMQMSFNPMFCFGPNPFIGMMPNPPNSTVMGGNWSAMYNPVNVNNMNNNMNNTTVPQSPGKMNVVFKTTAGTIKNIQADFGTTIGQLIILYLKRMDRENLIGNEKDICFLYDAAKLKYDDNRKIEQVFKFGNPSVMVNDVQNLIGAY